MSNTLHQFDFKAQVVRVEVDENGNPWFLAKDVCNILGYSNDRDAINRHCQAKGVVKRDTLTSGGMQLLTFINEGNLYRLIIKSNKPEAEPFEAWVCDEVLPSIRKHGYYVNPNAAQKPQSDLFDDMPNELPPFQRVKPSLLIKLGKMSKSLAQAYLIECGVTPDYVQQQLSTLGDAAPMLGVNKGNSVDALASGFVADWQTHLIEAPFIPCLSEQALRLFHVWLHRNGHPQTIADNYLMAALYRHPSLYGKRARIAKGRDNPTRKILMISGENPPVGVDFTHWLGECVLLMEDSLIKLEGD